VSYHYSNYTLFFQVCIRGCPPGRLRIWPRTTQVWSERSWRSCGARNLQNSAVTEKNTWRFRRWGCLVLHGRYFFVCFLRRVAHYMLPRFVVACESALVDWYCYAVISRILSFIDNDIRWPRWKVMLVFAPQFEQLMTRLLLYLDKWTSYKAGLHLCRRHSAGATTWLG
jgi:hypothetical protein